MNKPAIEVLHRHHEEKGYSNVSTGDGREDSGGTQQVKWHIVARAKMMAIRVPRKEVVARTIEGRATT